MIPTNFAATVGDFDLPEDTSSSGSSEECDFSSSANESDDEGSERENGDLEGADDTAENRIDGDFQFVHLISNNLRRHNSCHRRLLQDIQDDDSKGRSSLNKIWDVSFRQDESQFQDDIRVASGIGKIKGKGKGKVSLQFALH